MHILLIIFKKELIDTLRDRRTLIMMIAVPLLLAPGMIFIMTKVEASQMKKAEEKILRVGLITHGNAGGFRGMLLSRKDLLIREDITADSARSFIRRDSLDAMLTLSPQFDDEIAELRSGTVQLIYRSSQDYNIARDRLLRLIKSFEDSLLSDRFKRLNLDESIVEVVEIDEEDVASTQERLGKLVGGFLPYIFVIFCFMGSMYPAIDLAAGEKERGTLETLLTTPASRIQVLMGKFVVVVLVGVTTAAISILGIYVALQQSKEMPPELLEAIMGILAPESILLVLSLLLPLTIFFAALLLSISIFARSFKEAQSFISPMMIVVILPVAVGMIPGIDLDTTTALIPVLNVSLATREIMAGTAEFGLLMEVYLSLIFLAGLSLYGSKWWFEREETIFRGV